MEALATLVLVCNITQLVEQGLSLVKFYRQVQKAGSSAENSRMQQLMTTATAVDEGCIHLDSPRPLNALDSQIRDVAQKAVATSYELNQCLHYLKYKDDAGKVTRSSTGTFWKTLRRRDRVSDLYKQYERLQMVLQTSLLGNVNRLLLQIRDEQTQELIKISATNDAIRKLLEGDSRLAVSAYSALHDFKQSCKNSMQHLERKMERPGPRRTPQSHS